ncbi:polysaccharide deacetylase family protein [Paenarthrobacter aurescens]|uniref:polysaccharide deacetylase family protein n=1 Tax=Paenarthrobacter aurescens TaxID=43663 RepID=UPI0021BF2A7B|nr:polysaccharide deacetylase family protein [Paenarthrobacter aurescens]MCT9868232.1 polysaccharide deacetylase family protein [Paenarthrobacter aurescens]
MNDGKPATTGASRWNPRRRVVVVVVLAAVAVLAVVLALLVTAAPMVAPEPLTSSTATTTAATTTTATTATATSAAGTVAPAPVESSSEATDPVIPDPIGPPMPAVPAVLLGRDLEAIPATTPVIALTFDAGANAAALDSILLTLSLHDVKATFFLTGNWASANSASVARIVAAEHRLGNHSMSHPGFTQLTDAQIAEELLGAEDAVRAAGGDPRPFFRFPYGERDSRVIATVNKLGYVAVRWSVDTLGWKGTSGGASQESVLRRVVDGLRPGAIILMHIGSNPDDGTTLDADALPGIIEAVRRAGYGFVSLDYLLAG